mgnify:CR=1 FL=1
MKSRVISLSATIAAVLLLAASLGSARVSSRTTIEAAQTLRVGLAEVVQAGTVTVQVVDAASRRPVAEAAVGLGGNSKDRNLRVYGTTDSSGRITITGVPREHFEVEVRKTGYRNSHSGWGPEDVGTTIVMTLERL